MALSSKSFILRLKKNMTYDQKIQYFSITEHMLNTRLDLMHVLSPLIVLCDIPCLGWDEGKKEGLYLNKQDLITNQWFPKTCTH